MAYFTNTFFLVFLSFLYGQWKNIPSSLGKKTIKKISFPFFLQSICLGNKPGRLDVSECLDRAREEHSVSPLKKFGFFPAPECVFFYPASAKIKNTLWAHLLRSTF